MEGSGRAVRCRSGLVALFLFLIPLCSAVAVDAEWKDHIIEHQRFTLKYITSFPGRSQVDIGDPLWPEGIEKISGPYTAQRTIQRDDGSYATVLQLIYTLRAGNAGIFGIPPVEVSDGTEVQQSESLFIPVLRRDESFLKYPLVAGWQDLTQDAPTSLYAGQAFPLVLIMHNMEEISLPESVRLSTPDDAFLEKVRGIGDIGYDAVGADTLFHVPMETWMLTPSQSGIVELGAATVQILGLTRKTAPLKLEIRPLPEELASTAAVGDFRYTLAFPEREILSGNQAVLTVRVDGTGNLNYLNLPEPVFPEGLNVLRKEISDYRAASGGYKGYRELEFRFSSEEEGAFSIEVPGFNWIDPETGRISRRSAESFSFRVLSLLDSLQEDAQSFALVSAQEMVKERTTTLYRNPWLYLFLLPGPLFLLLVRLGVFRKSLLVLLASLLFLSAALQESLDTSWIESAQQAFDSSEFEQALDLYETRGRDWEARASFLYNRGVLRFLNGAYSSSVADLRSALKLRPTNAMISGTLSFVEEYLGLEHQPVARLFIAPDLLFILLLLIFNLVFVFLALYRLKRQAGWTVLMIFLSMLLSLAGTTELVRSLLLLHRKEAVISSEISIRKIPEEGASPWIALPEGTAVRMIRSYDGFVLIQTAYGLEGWVPRDDLIVLNGEAFEI